MFDRVPCQTQLGYSAEVHQFLTKWSRNWARNQRIPYLSKSEVFLSSVEFSDPSGSHFKAWWSKRCQSQPNTDVAVGKCSVGPMLSLDSLILSGSHSKYLWSVEIVTRLCFWHFQSAQTPLSLSMRVLGTQIPLNLDIALQTLYDRLGTSTLRN